MEETEMIEYGDYQLGRMEKQEQFDYDCYARGEVEQLEDECRTLLEENIDLKARVQSYLTAAWVFGLGFVALLLAQVFG